MMRLRHSPESWLEAGLLVMGMSVLSALTVLVWGRTSGSRQRGRRQAENTPALGAVPAERHKNVQSVSAR